MKRSAKFALSFAAGALIAAAAGAQKAYVDYDKTADLAAYKTFAIAEQQGEESLAQRSPLAHQHLVDGIRKRILAGGRLTESASDPDLYITYRVASKEEMSVNTTGYAMGPGWGGGYYWGGGWGGGAWGASTTTVNTYTVGTLMIDVWDAEAKRAVWRGVATGTVPENPQKGIKKIDKALDKLVAKWADMQGK
jgi:hypothetical protein